MRALVIYGSVFGNTEKVAIVISESIKAKADVKTLRVGDVKEEQINGLDLLIVGSPTRAFRPTKNITAFLKKIPRDGLRGINVTSFDTRADLDDAKSGILKTMAGVFGYAAKPISDNLVKKGGNLVSPPEGFYVKESEGPLKEGELERAASWAKTLIKSSS
jgi:flavodoxin